jgi:RNA ligase (TIGR02306 family)
MRKMATIRKIDSLRPIEGADAIECAVVGGWTVVTKKGEYNVGDLAVYCEIDSFIPTAIAPFLTKPGHYAKTFEGVEGERLRTMKLRGQLSQGLLLPFTAKMAIDIGAGPGAKFTDYEGTDVSEVLGIVKYEAPVPAELAGEVKGMFPSVIPKTDQERIQNLKVELAEWLNNDELHWEVTEKLEGSSMTVYMRDGEVGVCSRNLDLKPNADNSLWRAANKYNLPAKLIGIGRNIAIQGEIVGNGIQGNIYQMRDQDFLVYDIYDIDAGRYFTPGERKAFVAEHGLNHCPVLAYSARLTDTLGLTNMDQILKFAEGKSVMGMIGCEREGVVFKCHEKAVSFKAISNKYLLKHGG